MVPNYRLDRAGNEVLPAAWAEPDQAEASRLGGADVAADASAETLSDLYGEDVRDYDLGEGD